MCVCLRCLCNIKELIESRSILLDFARSLLDCAPIMPVFCLLLLYSYYSNNFAGEIDGSLDVLGYIICPINLHPCLLNNHISIATKVRELHRFIWKLQESCMILGPFRIISFYYSKDREW